MSREKKSTHKHLGKASHPTEDIYAHKGHMAAKQTKGTRKKLAVVKTAKLKKKE